MAILSFQEKGVLFRFEAKDANIVYLGGSFNNWNFKSTPMKDEDGDGIWEVMSPLDKGEYQYKFVVDGNEWCSDPSIEKTDKDGNSIIYISEEG